MLPLQCACRSAAEGPCPDLCDPLSDGVRHDHPRADVPQEELARNAPTPLAVLGCSQFGERGRDGPQLWPPSGSMRVQNDDGQLGNVRRRAVPAALAAAVPGEEPSVVLARASSVAPSSPRDGSGGAEAALAGPPAAPRLVAAMLRRIPKGRPSICLRALCSASRRLQLLCRQKDPGLGRSSSILRHGIRFRTPGVCGPALG